MATCAKILADSVSPDGVRLTTLECIYPRIIHAEIMTHRQFSRLAASSRAVPVEKMIRKVEEDPYIPTRWGKNQKGMQAEQDVSPEAAQRAAYHWLQARDYAVERAKALLACGIHKQLTNRLLEPFLWYTALITATEWSNFFNLRCNPAAHPEIRLIAELMRDAMEQSRPVELGYGGWHLPLWGSDEDLDAGSSLEDIRKISVARCARISYLTHDGKRDPQADVELHDRLLAAGHCSPFEMVARPMNASEIDLFKQPIVEWRDGAAYPTGRYTHFLGNLDGWVQYRKTIPHEADILGKASAE